MVLAKQLTTHDIWGAIYEGSKALLKNPCSICVQKLERKRKHFHGSDWGKCPRLVQYSLMYGDESMEEKITGKDALFLSDGHLHERSIVDALRCAGFVITHRENDEQSEVKTVDQVNLPDELCKKFGQSFVDVTTIAHTDGVIDGAIVLECKSVKSYTFREHFLKGVCPKNYFGQVQSYLHAHNLDRAFLVAKHRETSEIAPPIEILKDAQFIKKRLAILASILLAVEHHTWVKKEYKDRSSIECKYCPFQARCWNLE